MSGQGKTPTPSGIIAEIRRLSAKGLGPASIAVRLGVEHRIVVQWTGQPSYHQDDDAPVRGKVEHKPRRITQTEASSFSPGWAGHR